MPLAINQFSAFSHTPSLKEIFCAPKVSASVVRLPIMSRAVPRHAAMLFPVKHIDLMSDKPEVFPPIISNVTVDVVDVASGLLASHQEIGDPMLKVSLVAKVDLLVFGRGRRFDQLPVLGAVIRMLNPKQFSAVRFVSDATQKIRRYLLDFHAVSIPFQQAMSNYG